jgi:hypothetical protein
MENLSSETIDHHTLLQLVQGKAVTDVVIVGKQRWEIVVSYGTARKRLSATNSKQTRVFAKLETAILYLQKLGVKQAVVDFTHYMPSSSRARPDRAEALKKAHAAIKAASSK